MGNIATHITHHVSVDPDQFRELTISLVYFSCSTPQTGRNAHRRKDTVVIQQESFERFFYEDKILVQRVQSESSYECASGLTISRNDCATA